MEVLFESAEFYCCIYSLPMDVWYRSFYDTAVFNLSVLP